MLHPIEYFKHVRDTRKNQRLMARIGLNALYDPDAYPVDLSELDKLTDVNRTMVAGFMNGFSGAKRDKYRWCEDEVRDLVAMAKQRPVETASSSD